MVAGSSPVPQLQRSLLEHGAWSGRGKSRCTPHRTAPPGVQVYVFHPLEGPALLLVHIRSISDTGEEYFVEARVTLREIGNDDEHTRVYGSFKLLAA